MDVNDGLSALSSVRNSGIPVTLLLLAQSGIPGIPGIRAGLISRIVAVAYKVRV